MDSQHALQHQLHLMGFNLAVVNRWLAKGDATSLQQEYQRRPEFQQALLEMFQNFPR